MAITKAAWKVGLHMDDFMKNEPEILQMMAKIMPYIPGFFDKEEDVSAGLVNREIFLINQPSKSLPLRERYGDRIPEGGLSQALETGRPVVREIPESVYGVPFRSYSVPLKDDSGRVVGAISIGRSLRRSDQLKSLSQNLADYLSQSNESIQSLSRDVQKVLAANEGIAELSKQASSDAESSSKIVKLIQDISLQTNLLGINAAIEATRAGASGRGFRVVAEEIQRLSQSASDSVAKIEAFLKEMSSSVDNISDRIVATNALFQSQAAILEEIANSLGKLNKIGEQVRELSDKL